MQVAAHMNGVQFFVFVEKYAKYECVYFTEPPEEQTAYLLYTGKGLRAHYDVLEVPPNNEGQDNDEREQQVQTQQEYEASQVTNSRT